MALVCLVALIGMGTGSSTETFGFSSPENSVKVELEDKDDEDDEDVDDDDELDRCRLLVGVWELVVAPPATVKVLTRARSGVVKLPWAFPRQLLTWVLTCPRARHV